MLSVRSNNAPTTFGEAAAYLGNRDDVRIMHNTSLVRDHLTGGIAVVLHRTPILRFLPDGRIMLHSGGYRSVTTKRRMNVFLPAGIGVMQKDYEWYVTNRGTLFDFEDGMVVEP